MPRVLANGITFHVRQLGEHAPGDDTVVFIHGLAVDNMSSWWYTCANPVARHIPVLLYDLRGHGLSDRPLRGYSLDDMVDDLTGVLKATGTTGRLHLVGNSFGGVVAVAYALAHPERVASLMLIEAHVDLVGHEVTSEERLAKGLTLAGEFVSNEEALAWFERLGEARLGRMASNFGSLVLTTSLVEELSHADAFSPEQLSSIACPTFGIFGERSDIVERAKLLSQIIPDFTLKMVPEANHFVIIQQPAEIRSLVLDWLERHGALPATRS
jgi:pimeloyl-ACP methyl ester carboxylesterase